MSVWFEYCFRFAVRDNAISFFLAIYATNATISADRYFGVVQNIILASDFVSKQASRICIEKKVCMFFFIFLIYACFLLLDIFMSLSVSRLRTQAHTHTASPARFPIPYLSIHRNKKKIWRLAPDESRFPCMNQWTWPPPHIFVGSMVHVQHRSNKNFKNTNLDVIPALFFFIVGHVWLNFCKTYCVMHEFVNK